MPLYLGIDTSNYTTSVAVFDSAAGTVIQQKKLLPVASGKLGLKQSDAVFLHVRQLGTLLEAALGQSAAIAGVAASASPRDEEGSYMPCFLVGLMAAQAVSASAKVPLFTFSHQCGHVAAALYSAGRLELLGSPFLAFHISGGTTQCLLVEPDGDRILRVTTIAETLDLNAGQAVDRVGGMLGLEFPAGPRLEELARQSQNRYRTRPTFKGADCCLSGLENLCARRLEEGEAPADVARFLMDYLAALMLEMTHRALERHPGLPLVYAGGVMSNGIIRAALEDRYAACFAQPAFSSDNAAGTAVLCAIKNGGWKPC